MWGKDHTLTLLLDRSNVATINSVGGFKKFLSFMASADIDPHNNNLVCIPCLEDPLDNAPVAMESVAEWIPSPNLEMLPTNIPPELVLDQEDNE